MRNNLSAEICGCKGCHVIDECDMFQMDSFYVYGCPCRECLIKMVCEETCKNYNTVIVRIYHDRSFIRNMKKVKRPMRIAEKKNILRERF